MQRLRVTLPVVIAIGSNLGDREQALRDAIRSIDALAQVRVTAASDIVQSPALKPDGIDDSAPSYLNAVILARTSLDPEQLLIELNRIERDLGRVREARWDDRTIDLDIVAVDGLTRHTETLTLPHPRAFQRAFVLVPWAQVAPAATLPGRGRVAALAAAATDPVHTYPAAPLLPGVDG